ncbi:hypothetical protein [Bradyrhizobium sp. DASA03120]|uniref:hypothetical protein n=1 Tax=Bradyrhizobium sp. SMVTL-02 TaxID=3395917 RepID=UPI003F6EB94B
MYRFLSAISLDVFPIIPLIGIIKSAHRRLRIWKPPNQLQVDVQASRVPWSDDPWFD